MAKKIKEKQINLLPQEEFEASTFGRTLKWVLTTFRYIVIATEMIVMAAFLSRFVLDAKSSQLIDDINQKKTIVSSYSIFENKFRQTQSQIALFATYNVASNNLSPILDEISGKIPSDIILTETNINGSKLELTGTTQNQNDISLFLQSLNSGTNFTSAAVTSVNAKEGNPDLTFMITATIKGRANGN
ncbi:MAG TPA: PilN domain-containing protein [Patescibacteria group bacterium]|nr:PilN domain-containing protein [Patescibacteria group bacterium]